MPEEQQVLASENTDAKIQEAIPGNEPRWKWMLADAIVTTDRGEGRAKYVAYLEENDVLGLFSWLLLSSSCAMPNRRPDICSSTGQRAEAA